MAINGKQIARSLGLFAVFTVWCLLMSAPGARAQTGPQITHVEFSGSSGNYTVTTNGSGFGRAEVSLPYTGDVSNFRIGDNAELGHGEWGYSGDGNV